MIFVRFTGGGSKRGCYMLRTHQDDRHVVDIYDWNLEASPLF
jgi:hypothetical protein